MDKRDLEMLDTCLKEMQSAVDWVERVGGGGMHTYYYNLAKQIVESNIRESQLENQE
jgi:hypothetical protein